MLFLTAALGVYFWARHFVSAQQALVAGIVYTLAPYHLVQLYQAFLLAEFAGAAVIPFCFAFTERVCRNRKPLDIAGLSLSYAALIYTHLPLAVIGSITLLLYALLRLGSERRVKTLIFLSIGVVLGLALSAPYWTTMVTELHWIRADRVSPDASLDYRNNFILSTLSPENLNVWWMNILLLASLALFWPGLVIFRRSASATEKGLRVIALVFLFTIFMATPLSRPLWAMLPPLRETQFPWRWLTLVSMFGPILVAIAIPFWLRFWKTPKRPLLLLAAGTLVASMVFSFSHIIREAGYLNSNEFSQTLDTIRGSQGISYWWPIWSAEAPRPMEVEIDSGSRPSTVTRWEPLKRTFHLTAGDQVEARVRTFYYPHWKATANGEILPTRPAPDGALLVSASKEAATITLEFREPARVRWARVSVTLALVMLTLLAITDARQRFRTTGTQRTI
jgi:hypothetical protein